MTQVIDNTDAPNDTALNVVVESTGGPSTAPSYDISPEDAHYVQSIDAMNVFEDVPPPYQYPSDWKVPPLRLTALPVEKQAEVRDALATVAPERRDAKEQELVADVIRKMRPAIRMKTGLGSTALPYHRAQLAIAREYTDLVKEFERNEEQLMDVAKIVFDVDQTTGKKVQREVFAIEGNRRRILEARQREIMGTMGTLYREDGSHGFVAANQLKQAMFESVQLLKQRQAEIDDNKAARAMAEQMVRDERIKKRAESLAAMKRNSL